MKVEPDCFGAACMPKKPKVSQGLLHGGHQGPQAGCELAQLEKKWGKDRKTVKGERMVMSAAHSRAMTGKDSKESGGQT